MCLFSDSLFPTCLFFWLWCVFIAVHALSLAAESGGYSLAAAALGLLDSGGSSCCGAWALGCAGSGGVARGLVTPRHVGSYQARDQIRVPCISRQILNH